MDQTGTTMTFSPPCLTAAAAGGGDNTRSGPHLFRPRPNLPTEEMRPCRPAALSAPAEDASGVVRPHAVRNRHTRHVNTRSETGTLGGKIIVPLLKLHIKSAW